MQIFAKNSTFIMLQNAAVKKRPFNLLNDMNIEFCNYQIRSQYDFLDSFFKEQITSDYIYVDVPSHLNIGDWLIALGCFELLKKIKFKCIDKTTWFNLENSKISDDTIIILHGGGNFGDLYRGATEARNEIIKRYPNNKIIILPQTITYINQDLLKADSLLYEAHNDLHICVRDRESFNLLRNYCRKTRIYLLPDTAVGLCDTLPKQNKITSKTLIINRKDKEIDKKIEKSSSGEVIKDWQDILHDIHFNLIYYPYLIIRKIQRMSKEKCLHRLSNFYLINIMQPFVLKRVTMYFLQFDLVKTTRLHGFIFASLLGIKTIITDNKYNKISNYQNTWFSK